MAPNKKPGMTALERISIYTAAANTMREWYGERLAEKGACLYWNQVAMRELALRGHRPVLQAGDLHWRMVAPENDNGQEATYFGYEFDLSQPFSQRAIEQGLFPECHVWCALPDENAIVDFSCSYLPQIAEQRHGYRWTAPRPPKYVFGVPPRESKYIPKKEAIIWVWRFIAEKLAPEEERETILNALPV